MFDFGAGELIVIGVVALVAIGPKELPGLLRTIGQAVGKMRRMAGEFQGQFNEAMREADMADAQKLITDIKTDISGISIEPNPTPTPVYPFSYSAPAPALDVNADELSGSSTIDAASGETVIMRPTDIDADDKPEPKKRTRKVKVEEPAEPVIVQSDAIEVSEDKPKRRKAIKKTESEEEAS